MREYKTEDLTIIWKPELCQHAGECRPVKLHGVHKISPRLIFFFFFFEYVLLNNE